MTLAANIEDIDRDGFAILGGIYSDKEVESMIAVIQNVPAEKDTFRKTKDLFAIRQFIKEVPAIAPLIFNERLKKLINTFFGSGYFVSKSIYFDKPALSNWFVAYHQDLTISVDKKADLDGYGPWTVKQDQFAVQPPISILQNNFTIRIHLDNADKNNGALKVIQGSHTKGEYRANAIDHTKETEVICPIKRGGIMVMRPLLLHSSSRTINNNSRRVIHIEFSNAELPAEINWSEKYQF